MQARGLIHRGLEALGLRSGEEQVEAFLRYLGELRKWNRAHSLTALRSDRDIITKHFLDSALYLEALGRDVSVVADVGSGAGFPGIPLKILRPSLSVHLIEPTGKKAAFLRHMVRTLELAGVAVLEQRVEYVHDLHVDAALTRALFSAATFYEKARHIVRPGGLLVMSKGPKAEGEVEGLAVSFELKNVPLPGTDIIRTLIIMKNEENC
jgi:16S rRNA (guanine527-N7)-methyltransferase